METAIRFSQNAPPGTDGQKFLRVDATEKAFWLCRVTSVNRQKVKYEVLHASSKVPAFRAFDWHPVSETVVAVGQAGGEATLLNIAEGNQDSISFSVRSQRLCNTVALSAHNLIAVGLDKVRVDFCLNIWDFNQRPPNAGSKNFSRASAEPLHRLAGGEPISSLKFFNEKPQLLIAGVKGQFVRLYDLREPSSSTALQFPTRCVHHLAIDSLDDNYFASCYPSSDPLICLWDRRMASRTHSSHVNLAGNSALDSKQPEVSLEIKAPIESSGVIWSLRFSKSRRGCLGVLSNMGQLKAYRFGQDSFAGKAMANTSAQARSTRSGAEPAGVYLSDVKDVEYPYPSNAPVTDQKKRIVSFDFTTSTTSCGEPKLIVLTGDGEIRMTGLDPPPEPVGISPSGLLWKGSNCAPGPILDFNSESIGKSIDRVRRTAEPRNTLRQAYRQMRQKKTLISNSKTDLRRMSSFANQCWNTDLGFFEKGVPVGDMLRLISASRLRCESGYLLNPTKNKTVVSDSQWLESYWTWIEQAERISKNGNMKQDNIDLSYIGVYGIWMEEIMVRPRSTGGTAAPVSTVIKNLTHRLNIPVRRFCHTEYRAHRQLCLHVSGLAWSRDELESIVKKLMNGNQHTKAAAIALFASDDKLAYQALRSKTSAQTHKMLAMALAGSKHRRQATAPSSPTSDDSRTDREDDWGETIASLSADLTDPYARAILAYVKSGDWIDVLDVDALPLKQRVGVAIRHLDDNDLTAYIGRVTRQVIEAGDIEGIILTGTGTSEGLGLLSSYARTFNDLQTAILGLLAGGAAERFIVKSNDRDAKARRTVEALRETYRAQIMQWGLKLDRVRFDVTASRILAQSSQITPSRPEEQVRLVCTYCSGTLTQFSSTGTASSNSIPGSLPQAPGGARITETSKHPLTSERAAVTGTVCPKCGRHLPRCGVCDLWLGTPDETYSKWYLAQRQQQQQLLLKKASDGIMAGGSVNTASDRRKHGSVDLAASMSGSFMTTIGPSNSVTASTTTLRATPAVAGNVLQTILNNNDDTGDGDDDNGDDNGDGETFNDELEQARMLAEEKWQAAMHKFTVLCVTCGHGFHAAHARLWFEGRNGRPGHRICPVPGCGCRCKG